MYKALTEEIYQEEFGAGLAALSHTATRVLARTGSSMRNLMRVRDGKVCERKNCLENAPSR